ncbi:MAG: T9SS type A sorting domain-containing protein [Bacteroidetes bacterium]|nr:T9SS type A sorting domain-containing protein [Bacteroidota bacterium]
MKKSTLLFLLIFALVKIQAQDYLISFAGSGAAIMVDSVRVENLNQGASLTVGSGNQLQLLGTLSGMDRISTNAESPLLIYPNPAKGEVVVTFYATSNANATIELTDLTCRQVAKEEVFLSTGRQSFRVCGLKNGALLLHVRSEGYHFTGKIINRSTSASPIQIIYSGQPNGQTDPGNIKQTEAIIQMQYTAGDLVKFTGRSGIYGTVVMDIPTSSRTITFAFAPCTDYDNNHYTIVGIGAQIWMAENLKSAHYPDGTAAAYYDYNLDPNNSLIYGRLYAWSPAMNGAASSNTNPSNVQGICPNGWRLPSEAEWQQFAGFLGGLNIGGKLKETGNGHWTSPNTGATDEVGFTALPAGMWAFWDEFQWLGDRCAFSTSTGNLPMVEVTAIMLETSNGVLTVGSFHPDDAISVRCVKNL